MQTAMYSGSSENGFERVLTPFLEDRTKTVLDDMILYMMEQEEDQIRPSHHRADRTKKIASNVAEVVKAVLEAKEENTVLRVVGSSHSAADAIYPSNRKGVTLSLTDELIKIEFLKKTVEEGEKYLYCRVGAGCHLGKDPMDPNSTLEDSLCYQVALKKYSIPALGGIIHQTVGGYLMTGSAGGTIKHGFSDCVRKIEFVDGNGTLHLANLGTELWCAVGVSMGLFGVITHVTLRLPQKGYRIKGKESGYEFGDSSLGDVDGQSRLKESLEKHEYFRVNWLPQKGVQRVQEWEGEQNDTDNAPTIPYYSALSSCLSAGMAAIVLSLGDCILLEEDVYPVCVGDKIIGGMLSPFVPLESKPFWDVFHKTLPMDNMAYVDSLLRVDFTEIWMPIDQCQSVIDKLKKLFEDRQVAGNFATEIYAAKKSPFWLSMSYEENMVRVDPYWWTRNKRDMREYFSYFWDVLLDIPTARLHWGKYLPRPGQKCGTKTFNLKYLKSVYPKMDDWLKKRQEMDPHQIFVSDYWREIFEIPQPLV